MSRDILKARDAIDRAKGLGSGLDALVALMLGCDESDIPDSKSVAQLIWAIQRDLKKELEEAESYLTQ